MLTRTLFAAVFAVLAVLAAVPAGAQDADEIFERLTKKYESIEALRAEFSQTMRSSYMEGEETFSGELVASGDSYRVETADRTLVTDGTATWVYMPAENQLLVNDHSEDDQTFSVSSFLFDYDDRFDVSGVTTDTIDGERYYVLTLEPESSEAFFTEATLSMRTRDDIITRLEVVDVNGTTMVFDLTNIELDPPLDADIFRFTPPDDTEIIDLRS